VTRRTGNASTGVEREKGNEMSRPRLTFVDTAGKFAAAGRPSGGAT
jgi:hypothetical protein